LLEEVIEEGLKYEEYREALQSLGKEDEPTEIII
jgi:hypothetical protein